MASLRRGALLAAAIALCAPTTSGARYYLCAFECAGCGAEAGWTSCRPEPCDAALDEDACADGSTPTRRPLARPPDAPADASDDEAAAHAAVGADFAAALRRNGTEAFLDGPAACLRLLPAPAPVDPSALGVAAGLRAFGRWGTFKERCAVVGKLAFAAERVLAETPAAAVRELSAADACQRSLAAALRGGGVRQLRSCQLAKDERLCERMAEAFFAITCEAQLRAAQAGERQWPVRREAARQAGLLLSARRAADGTAACGAPRAAVECAAESDKFGWVVGSALLGGALLFAAQLKAFVPLKTATIVEGYLPDE